MSRRFRKRLSATVSSSVCFSFDGGVGSGVTFAGAKLVGGDLAHPFRRL